MQHESAFLIKTPAAFNTVPAFKPLSSAHTVKHTHAGRSCRHAAIGFAVCNETVRGAKMAAAVSLAVEMWSVIRDGISVCAPVTSYEAVS